MSKKELLEQTRTIIFYATTNSLYYGGWLTAEHDIVFQKIFIKRKRKRVIHQNIETPTQNMIKTPTRRTKSKKRKILIKDSTPTQKIHNAPTLEDIFNEYDSFDIKK